MKAQILRYISPVENRPLELVDLPAHPPTQAGGNPCENISLWRLPHRAG